MDTHERRGGNGLSPEPRERARGGQRRAGGDPPAAPTNGSGGDDPRPTIAVAKGILPQMTDAAEAALLRAEEGVYQRAETIVRIGLAPVVISGSRQISAPLIVPVNHACLREAFARVANWVKFNARTRSHLPADVPDTVVASYLDRLGLWRLPPLAGLVNAPTLRNDGSVLQEPGYDEPSALLYDPGGVAFPRVPDRPDRGAAFAALRLVKDELLETFPFVSDADRSVALSALLTAPVRKSLRTAPLHAFSAPSAGSGKTMLGDMASIIATGREAGVIGQSATTEEFEKTLGSMLLRGESVIMIDNCEHPLRGEMLCRVLTQPLVRVRILGESKVPEVTTDSLVIATGNNLVLEEDVVRRVLRATIDPGCEDPESRSFAFNPVDRAKGRRAAFAVALLTVLRAYAVAGWPGQGLTPLGGFEGWSNWVRSALVWLDEADPVAVMSKQRADDPKRQNLTALLTSWNLDIGSHYTTLRTAIEQASSGKEELYSALSAIAGGPGGIDIRRLGNYLRSVVGRPSGGFVLEQGEPDSHTKVMTWRVALASDRK